MSSLSSLVKPLMQPVSPTSEDLGNLDDGISDCTSLA